jgi:arsenate reductase (thioredoxin)
MTEPRLPTILVLCTGHRGRSQMAEGWLRYFAGQKAEIHSADTQPQGLHPLAVRVMAEAGLDISTQRPRPVNEVTGRPFDLVVTIGDAAKEACPTFPAAKRLVHHAFEDPEQADLPDERRLDKFRQVRNEIRDWTWDLVVSEL